MCSDVEVFRCRILRCRVDVSTDDEYVRYAVTCCDEGFVNVLLFEYFPEACRCIASADELAALVVDEDLETS